MLGQKEDCNKLLIRKSSPALRNSSSSKKISTIKIK